MNAATFNIAGMTFAVAGMLLTMGEGSTVELEKDNGSFYVHSGAVTYFDDAEEEADASYQIGKPENVELFHAIETALVNDPWVYSEAFYD